MKVIKAAEDHSKETYQRIKHRLTDLKDLSASNLALKRLIKRNMKQETSIAEVLGLRGRQMEEENCRLGHKEELFSKIPYALARYLAEKDEEEEKRHGDALSMRDRSSHIDYSLSDEAHLRRLLAKRPAKVLDEQSYREMLPMSDSEDEDDVFDYEALRQIARRRENPPVSRTFYGKMRDCERDERLLKLVKKMSMSERVALLLRK